MRISKKKRVEALLNEFGFRYHHPLLIEKATRLTSQRTIRGNCRDIWDAAEQLIPLILNEDYYHRLQFILKDEQIWKERTKQYD